MERPAENYNRKDHYQYRKGFKVKLIEDYVSSCSPLNELSRRHGVLPSTFRAIKDELLKEGGYFRILESMKSPKKETPL